MGIAITGIASYTWLPRVTVPIAASEPSESLAQSNTPNQELD